MGGESLFFKLCFWEGHLKNVPLRGGLRFFGVTYHHLSLNSNLSLFRNYYRLHRKIRDFFNKTTFIMQRHGLPGVAALKIITTHLKTLLFEVHINLKIKHDKMSAEAKTISHQQLQRRCTNK